MLQLGHDDEDDVAEDDTDDSRVEVLLVQLARAQCDDGAARRLQCPFPEENDKDRPQEKKFNGQCNIKAALAAFFDVSLEFPKSN